MKKEEEKPSNQVVETSPRPNQEHKRTRHDNYLFFSIFFLDFPVTCEAYSFPSHRGIDSTFSLRRLLSYFLSIRSFCCASPPTPSHTNHLSHFTPPRLSKTVIT